MFISWWRQLVQRKARGSARKQRRRRLSSLFYRPWAELLEDRCVPSNPATSSFVYNRVAAWASYAANYVDFACSDGYFWLYSNAPTYYGPDAILPTLTGGYDGAHFVSCCIGQPNGGTGGGLAVPQQTSPVVPPAQCYGIYQAATLASWLENDFGYTVTYSSASCLLPGDVIYNSGGNVFLYLGSSNGYYYVAQHSPSLWDETIANTSSNLTYIHILDGTTTTLTSSVSGQNVTFTAQISDASYSSCTPVLGMVTFSDGNTFLGTSFLNMSGVATFSTATLTAGTHTIKATYNDSTNFFAPSGPATLTQTVTSNRTTPTVTVSGGPFTYNGSAHAATVSVKGVGGVTVSGSSVVTYNGSATVPTNAGQLRGGGDLHEQ